VNIIGRLWKWLKKKCLYAQFYEDFAGFSTAIENIPSQANTNIKRT